MEVEVANISPPPPALPGGVAAPALPMAVSAPALAKPAGIRLSAPQAAPPKHKAPIPLGAGSRPAPQPIKVAPTSPKSGMATVKLGVSSTSGKKAIPATRVPPKVGKGLPLRSFSCSGAQSKCGERAIKDDFGRRLAETEGTLWRTLFETERTLCETDARS
jgi:hypothetical protein